jgi:glycosyltransferase involved in cell wall biosynthesis
MGRGRRVCIVAPGYISSTPRAVREADALAAAGYTVRVVFSQGPLHEVRAFDDRLVQQSAWRATAVRWSKYAAEERWMHWRSGVRHRLSQRLPEAAWRLPGVAERAEGRVFPELALAAVREPADLFIGHYPVGLAAAAIAANRQRALVGYDIEDLFSEIWPRSPAHEKTRARVIAIEERRVPSCAYLTSASRAAAEWFAERFHTPIPIVIYNCHPWSDRSRLDSAMRDRTGGDLSLYWYSQTVSLDRGLQDAIHAAGLAGVPLQLHIRGAVTDAIQRELQAFAAAKGGGVRLHFHPLVSPSELLSRAVEHDVGLALEVPHSINRSLTVSNKLFLYMTAALAIAATDTAGQREVMADAPGSGILYQSGDVTTLAAQLRAWSQEPSRLAAAKQAALRAAERRWSLEREMERLVAAVDTLWIGRAGRVA